MPIGKRVVIIGGAMQGCELAEFLTIRGRTVTLVDTAEELGEGMLSEPKTRLFKWMHIKKISMITQVREYKEITRTGLTIINKDGMEQTLKADSIITALPVAPDTRLLAKLKDTVPEIYAIGDCREPGLIAHAVADGAKTGRKV